VERGERQAALSAGGEVPGAPAAAADAQVLTLRVEIEGLDFGERQLERVFLVARRVGERSRDRPQRSFAVPEPVFVNDGDACIEP
jgi:hypothetical protein